MNNFSKYQYMNFLGDTFITDRSVVILFNGDIACFAVVKLII